MLEIKVNGQEINISVEGEAGELLADFAYSFILASRHIASVAAKDEKAVPKVERELLATVIAVYITEATGRNIGSAEGDEFANILTKLLRKSIEMNILANMLDEAEPEGEANGTE